MTQPTFFEIIRTKLAEISARKGEMTQDQIAVMEAIVASSRMRKKITQQQIADSEPWLGYHKKYEDELVPDSKKRESTLRQVRQIIRDLRINYHVPIISDRNGYWIPTTSDEADQFIERLEAETKARIAASVETYKALRTSLNVRQSGLFESVMPDMGKQHDVSFGPEPLREIFGQERLWTKKTLLLKLLTRFTSAMQIFTVIGFAVLVAALPMPGHLKQYHTMFFLKASYLDNV